LRGTEVPSIDAGELRLEYFLGDESSYLRATSAESERVVELPARGELEDLVRLAISLFQDGGRYGVDTQLEIVLLRLSDLLLAPANAELRRSYRLSIVPDGLLWQLPFASLPLPSETEPLGAQRLLVDEHEIIFVSQMAASDQRGVDREPATLRTIAVIADPVYSSADPRLPISQPRQAASGEVPVLDRLPFSAREAESIRSLVPEDEELVVTGFEASRDFVLSGELQRYRILHFAAHAFYDGSGEENAAVVLSTFDRNGRPRNGLLTSYEVSRLELSAELVVLSACNTALGIEMTAGGPMSLARGFFDAGAEQVMVSQWQVSDRATAELMSRFYHGLLQDGLSPAAALRRAQLSMRGSLAWRSPYNWAGFVLQVRSP